MKIGKPLRYSVGGSIGDFMMDLKDDVNTYTISERVTDLLWLRLGDVTINSLNVTRWF